VRGPRSQRKREEGTEETNRRQIYFIFLHALLHRTTVRSLAHIYTWTCVKCTYILYIYKYAIIKPDVTVFPWQRRVIVMPNHRGGYQPPIYVYVYVYVGISALCLSSFNHKTRKIMLTNGDKKNCHVTHIHPHIHLNYHLRL